MMFELLFSGIVDVNIQGHHVLRFRKRDEDYVEYTIVGFGDQIVIYDYRKNGLNAIDLVLNTNQTYHFPYEFNESAQLNIFDSTDNNPLVIELRNTCQIPTHLLWIAVGLDNKVPIYEYDVGLVQQIDDAHIALLALLNIELNDLQLPTDEFLTYSSQNSTSTSSRISSAAS